MSAHVYHSETDSRTGITLKIVLDDSGSTESPLDSDESVIMAVLHPRHINPAKDHGLNSPEEIEEFAKANLEWQEFPLFMYDHSDTVYRPSKSGNPFSCPWDSGRVGSIFIKTADVLEPFNAAELVCEEYTSWVNGEIYGYVVEDSNGDDLDSCWGFVGDPNEFVLEEGREALKYEVEKDIKRRIEAARAERKRRQKQHRMEKAFCQLSAF